ncbi:MAG: VCBS repeat-containing protein [Eudoraea sp.]|uniref:VCBS repeat-containing protein n=1 Tax=Eudoraea sp. TaxID=1979955 RepID=UPI00326779C7
MKIKIVIVAICLLLMLITSCDNTEKNTVLFQSVTPQNSGLDFTNALTENDSINILDNEFVYNGSGVALGDLDGDGLDDIFLTGNQVDNSFFLNKGQLKFIDVSSDAGINKPDSLLWSSGVSIIDINLDGKQDIYICNTFYKNPDRRRNLLYINQGNNDSGTPLFEEMAREYGIADTSYSSHAQFFDYDNDGDLDLFIGVNRIEGINPSQFSPLDDDGTSLSRDRLYKNEWGDNMGHPVFKDVSEEAGIRFHGYSHSTLIHDFNEDGWMDIYVANDFLSNDLIYINNQDGTFTNRAGDIFKHFSLSSMGSDIADVNNNGHMDIFTSEMQPYYNKRKKLFQGPSSYQKEIFTKKYNYESQYTRNTLQLNLGVNPETGLPIFGDTGLFAGVQETDWSWAPLFADYDNDGWQDLFITNGFPKDVTDRDFGDFRVTASRLVSKEKLIAAIPEIKIPNFMFRNTGDLNFEDVTDSWGLNFGTYSNGAAYGDLDNDGDLDLVINNINDPVLLMENKLSQINPESHYLRVKLKGSDKNPAAFGSMVEIYSDGIRQKKSLISGRGYLSKPESVLHFGLGTKSSVDSIKIIWPGGGVQKLQTQETNRVLNIAYNPDLLEPGLNKDSLFIPMFKEAAEKYNLVYESRDLDFIDFNFQRTLPHKFSQYGPSLAVGDINNDGLDDMFLGASRKFAEAWFIQQIDGSFIQKEVNYKQGAELEEEDAGTLLFDADGDQDLDLYIARGCAQYPPGDILYKDILLLNDGNGRFSESAEGIPDMRSNSSTVRASDYDRDGDLDLFVGSRVLPMAYPKADRSYILRNESSQGNVRFVDVTEEVSPELQYPGLISDALWTDFNGDYWPDLILAEEWKPIRFFENRSGTLHEITESSGVQDNFGWWNSLAAADLDNDGDTDYVAGNFGKNIYFKADKDTPVRLYAKDLDDNGMIDPLISYYLRDSVGTKKEYLYHPWQDVVKQYVGIRKSFNSFGEFGEATLPEVFPDGLLDDATKLTFNYMQTSWIENLGDGHFESHPLPIGAQLAPVYGIITTDFNNDNLLDIALVGNDFGMEVQQGPADAFIGLLLKNKGNGSFETVSLEESHFFVPGDAKSLVRISVADEKSILVASQNNDFLKVYETNLNPAPQLVPIRANEVKCALYFKNNSSQIQEYYWGSSFQSQSSRHVEVNPNVKQIKFFDNTGKETRTLNF